MGRPVATAQRLSSVASSSQAAPDVAATATPVTHVIQASSASEQSRTVQHASALRSSVLPDPPRTQDALVGAGLAAVAMAAAPDVAPMSGYRPLPMMPASSERRVLPAPYATRPRPARWLSLDAEVSLNSINSQAAPPGSTSPHASDEATPGAALRTWLTSRNTSVQSHAAASPQPPTNMLPPRLATPAPVLGGNASADLSTANADNTGVTITASTQTSASAALTSLGRRTQAREARGRSSARENRTIMPSARDTTSASVSERLQNLDDIIAQSWPTPADTDEGLARAHAAIEGSRTALSQARDAIRNALVHSERLERIAGVLRRNVDSASSPAAISEIMQELQDLRSSYDLERSLAELRTAGAGIDRMLQVAIDNIRSETASLFTPADTASDTQDAPRAISTLSERRTVALADAQPLPTVRDIFRMVERPRETIEEGLLRGSRSLASDRLSRLPEPWATRVLRQPLPRRGPEAEAGRHPPAGPRWELIASAFDAAAQTPGVRDRVIALQASNNLPRTRTAAGPSSEPPIVHLPLFDHPIGPSQQAHTPPRNRARGGWRRLDENGDELECEGDGEASFLEPRLGGHSQTNPPRAGLGWIWRPASSRLDATHPSDEGTVWFSHDSDRPHSQSADTMSSTGRSISAGAYRFRADREMVGR